MSILLRISSMIIKHDKKWRWQTNEWSVRRGQEPKFDLFTMIKLLLVSLAAAVDAEYMLFGYFRTPAEALHLALTTDGFNYTALNKNRPVLNATIGNKSIRDPYILLDRDGQTYHIVTTNSWASTAILYYNTTDFITFSPGVVLDVMKDITPTAQCTWAPEIIEYNNQYFVYFASRTDPVNDVKEIWGTYVDFKTLTFTEPKVIFSPGYTVIDADMGVHESNNSVFLVFKDETSTKAVKHATSLSGSPEGPFTEISGVISPYLTEGPEIVPAIPNPLNATYLLYYDFFESSNPHVYGVSSSNDLVNFSPVGAGGDTSAYTVSFPADSRHGCFLTIPDSIAENLIAYYGY
jgi:Glycosyl hydrolases family 43